MKGREYLYILVALVSAVVYVVLASARGVVGLALDDAWIHQVYARNLALRGEFAFFPGQPSAGSTSPLWTVVLAPAYLLRIDPRVWSYLIGAMLLGLAAIMAARLARQLLPSLVPCGVNSGRVGAVAGKERDSSLRAQTPGTPLGMTSGPYARAIHSKHFVTVLVPLFLVLEWHMAWSAVSGMEIPLFVFLSLLLVERSFLHERAWVLGGIAGLLTLTRPEGIALAGMVGVAVIASRAAHPAEMRGVHRRTKQFPPVGEDLMAEREIASQNLLAMTAEQPVAMTVSPRALLGTALLFGLAFAVVVAPYVLLNLVTSGTVLPNTFYAKNVEYAVLFERVPFLFRWAQLLLTPWIGAQLLLLPGFIFGSGALIRRRNLLALVPIAWVVILPAMYALRLPVAYQHGRYEMPVIPFIIVYGVLGTTALFQHVRSRIARRTWALSTAVLAMGFWLLGGTAYATDVAVIDCEMVQTAQWVAANVSPGTLVAAHDIGALGYLYPHPFVDLAGLVSPDIIPVMRDQAGLREFMASRGVQYAVFFPDWYPALAEDSGFAPVHQQNCPAAREAGGTDMAVYRIVDSQK